MFSEIQEVFYFPIRRTKAIDTVLLVSAAIPFDRGGKYLTGVCVPLPAAFMPVHFVHLLALKNLPLPTLAFIQAWRLQSGEMISQLLTDLLPCLEADLGGP